MLLDGMKTPVSEAISSTGLAGGCVAPAGAVSSGNSVATVVLAVGGTPGNGCVLTATFKAAGVNSKIQGMQVSMGYNPVTGSWACGTNLVTAVQNKACTSAINTVTP